MVVLLNPEQVPQKLHSCMSNTCPGAYALFCAGLFLYVRCTDSPSKQPPCELVCCCKHSRTLPGMTNKRTSHIPQSFLVTESPFLCRAAPSSTSPWWIKETCDHHSSSCVCSESTAWQTSIPVSARLGLELQVREPLLLSVYSSEQSVTCLKKTQFCLLWLLVKEKKKESYCTQFWLCFVQWQQWAQMPL